MNIDLDKLRERYIEEHQVKCPECGHIFDNETLGESGLISYHGEDGEIELECLSCDTMLLVEEVVDRTWEVKKKGHTND